MNILDWPERAARRVRLARSPFEMLGFLRNVSHADPGTPAGAAFIKAGGSRILIQMRAPESDYQNYSRLPEWSRRWRAAGVHVDGWWRMNHAPGAPAAPGYPDIELWWPNVEIPDEYPDARWAVIVNKPRLGGVVTLGKGGFTAEPAGSVDVAIECFREGPASDHSITNSVAWWTNAGWKRQRLIVMLQGYGTPFAPPAEQAREALENGVRRVALYPLDGFHPDEILEVGRILRP